MYSETAHSQVPDRRRGLGEVSGCVGVYRISTGDGLGLVQTGHSNLASFVLCFFTLHVWRIFLLILFFGF